MLKALRNENEFTHDLYQLNKLVKGAGILNSEMNLKVRSYSLIAPARSRTSTKLRSA